MRRILFLFLLVLSTQSFGIVRIGLLGGISSANVTMEPASTTNARGGYMLGAALELGLGGDWNIQGEALYIQKGYIIPSTATVGEITVRDDYVEFPILLKYSFDLIFMKPFLIAGPYLGLKTKAESVLASTTTALTTQRATDLGVTMGGGFEFSLSLVTSMFAAVRYDMGLMNVVTDATLPSEKNKGVLIMGGFLFGI